VRQYYLRAAPEKGDIQVNLADKQHRTKQSHDIAVALRQRIEAIGKANGGVAKVVEVPPGPPVLSPIVAEIYGPDYAGQMAVGQQVRAAFGQTADVVAVDDSIEADNRQGVLPGLPGHAAETRGGAGRHRRGGRHGPGRDGCDAGPECRFEA